jgi:hypothetical protein
MFSLTIYLVDSMRGLWHTENDDEEQKNNESGWTTGWRQPKLSLRSCKEAVDLEYKVRKLLVKQLAGTDTYQKTIGKNSRVLAYGPFHHALPDKRDYRLCPTVTYSISSAMEDLDSRSQPIQVTC